MEKAELKASYQRNTTKIQEAIIMDKKCCNCTNLQMFVEAVDFGEIYVKYICKTTKREVDFNSVCNTKTFKQKK